ncbi:MULTISPECIES: hypothetical protein [Stenotrophomonas]|jgi:hypothetical protein|uniref:hypothetical protein n=1 Tax=Stenotrophomonas TaxID=40323 RepID=UPI00128B87DD|nr:hypothetical protein [Stenotrophomonas sp. BIO128-Bstrain]WIA62385.1 hypothetical protein POS15_03935 [Stenotrophomonas sp. BIO128-Bstrain]
MQSFFRPLSGSSARLALGLTLLGIAGAACADPELPEAPQSAQAVRCAAFYIDVPSAGNPVANLMLGSVVSKAAWMDQLKALMARGAEPPMTRLVVAGESEDVTRKAVQSALGSFKQQRLSYLTLTVAGQSPKMQGLQRSAEQLGITFRAATPERSAASPEARADAYLRGVCD